MSDLRLTSLKAKMKILLCMFLLYVRAVSVIGQSVELNGIIEESVRFEAEVNNVGSLLYKGSLIAEVTDRVMSISNDKYKGRVHWDTGYFSLSGLKLNDSGEYKVENHGNQASTSTFQLTVWINVSKPHLTITRNIYRCAVLCSADRGTGATLTLYKKGEKDPYATSLVRSTPNLDMTETVETGTYTCEARNPVSRSTSEPVIMGEECNGAAAGIWQAKGCKIWGLCLVLIALLHSRLV